MLLRIPPLLRGLCDSRRLALSEYGSEDAVVPSVSEVVCDALGNQKGGYR